MRSISTAMVPPARFRDRLRRLIVSERGMALPTAIFAMIATFGLAAAAILASTDVQQGTGRDADSKNAIAAADAGASVALLRLNRFRPTSAHRCVGPNGEWQTATAGWCPVTSVETVGGSSFTYQVSEYQKNSEVKVVSIGTAGGVSRRVEVGLISREDEKVFADEHLIGESDITVTGNPKIETDIGTNGSIKGQGQGNGSVTLCGDLRHGVGKESQFTPDCDGKVSEENKELPEIEPPANIATENSNCRLVPSCTKEPTKEVDTWSKKNGWESKTRTLTVAQNGTLTMGGTDYFICKLVVGPGTLYMAAGSHVRIFFDTPENCGMSNGAVRLEVNGQGNIVSSGFNPKEGKFDVPGFYMLGSPDIETVVKLEGNTGINEMILYAPYADLRMKGNAEWKGMIAAKSIEMGGNPTITSDPGIEEPDIYFQTLWERTHYVECTGASASTPNGSC